MKDKSQYEKEAHFRDSSTATEVTHQKEILNDTEIETTMILKPADVSNNDLFENKFFKNNPNIIVENILNSIGYTHYHMLLIITCGLLYFAEGAQLYSLNILMPAMKQIFAQETNSSHPYPILHQDPGKFMFTFLASSLFVGYMIGTSLIGVLTKYFGRRDTVNAVLILFSILTVLIFILENIYWISFCRCMIGFCMGIIAPLFLSNLSEFLPQENKEIVILSMYIFFRCGIIYFLLLFKVVMPNYELTDWRYAFMVASVPIILSTILTRIYLRNSPKLFLSKGQINETVESLQSLASQKPRYRIPEEDLQELREGMQYTNISNDSTGKNKSSFSLIFSKKYFLLTILSAILFICGSMVNICNIYALPLMLYDKKDGNDSQEGEHNHDMTNEILITQIVTIPAIMLSAIVCKVIGRKQTVVMGYIFCFLTTLFASMFQKGLIVSSAFVNFFIIFSLCTVKLYVIEAFPTHLRDYALAFCFGMAKVGDTFTPLLVNIFLKAYAYGPMLLINILCFCGFLSSYMLPFDTLDNSH
jgi:putative MFS transporter